LEQVKSLQESKKYRIPINYNHFNQEIIVKLVELINDKYHKIFVAVFVHGSISSNDVIKYSDFDGIYILKDRYQDSLELKRFLSDSMKIIYEFDPLQHHGWFHLLESELNDYKDNYLPVIALKNSICLFKRNNEDLIIESRTNQLDYVNSLIKNLNSINNLVKSNWTPKNIFQLKSFLSRIMLIPAQYYSAFNGKGILKKDSFIVIQKVFNQYEWFPIAIASEIREKWEYELNFFQKKIMTQNTTFSRKITKLFAAPSVPKNINKKLDDKFYNSLKSMIDEIFLRLNNI